MPKWHDETCESLLKKIKHSSYLLKKYPDNSYLRGCIQSESKQYRRLVKSKQKQFIHNLFENLNAIHADNPRGYMNLVKSLRDGTFDKKMPEDSSFISPEGWRSHFSALLNPPPPTQGVNQDDMKSYIADHCMLESSSLSIKIAKGGLNRDGELFMQVLTISLISYYRNVC